MRAEPKSTWPRATSICEIRSSTASCAPIIRELAMPGVYIRHTITHMAIRRDRGGNSLTVHAGVRGSSAALRLADRESAHPITARQYEFSRLNLSYTVLSKRTSLQLVLDGHVTGWDDPRMPTLAGLRRRGLPAANSRDFASRIGVTATRWWRWRFWSIAFGII